MDQVVLESGFSSLGVNAVAKVAGVSKVLIYRYFGDFEGLLEAWALTNSYWIERPQVPQAAADLRGAISATLTGQLRSLVANPAKREVLRWLLAEETKVGKRVLQRLEDSGVLATRSFLEKLETPGSLDTQALAALITAGINYLALTKE